MGNILQYTIKFDSNGNAIINQLTGASSKLQKSLSQTQSIADKFGASFLKINAIKDAISGVGEGIASINEPGLKLNSSMADLSAITGVTGQKLIEIEAYARKNAKTFGGDAYKSVESYKLILSQLGPEIAKTPAALDSMGKSVSVLSKTMGGDTIAATEVLTTAMNQYQISLDDPIKASAVMADMMNVMAAAAKEGSAELPAIKAALEQSGMAAKMAGVSFSETNSAIQVLDKAGKKAAEGGVALRNTLAILSEGRFLPKEVLDALKAAHVNIDKMGDKSLTLADRLNQLKPVLSDTALISKMFGRENMNAALALISGTDEITRYNGLIQGTNSAYEQAQIKMQATQEKMARMKATIDDLKIGFFELTGAAAPYIDVTMQAATTIAQLVPLFWGLAQVIGFITNAQKMQAMWTGIVSAATSVWTGIQWLFNASLWGCPVLIIAAGIAVLVIGVVALWQKFAGFRAVILTVWDTVKGFGAILFKFMIAPIKNIISGLGSIGSAIFKLFHGDFSGAWDSAKTAFMDLSEINTAKELVGDAVDVAKGVKGSYNQYLAQENAKGTSPAADTPQFAPGVSAPGISAPVPFSNPFNTLDIVQPDLPGAAGSNTNTPASAKGKATTEAIATGGTKSTNITITIKELIGIRQMNTGTLKESVKEIEDKVLDTMTRVVSLAQANAS